MIKAGLKAVKESGYAAGNPTEKFVGRASSAENFVDRGTELIGIGETEGTLGRIAFKTTKDTARGDNSIYKYIYYTCTGRRLNIQPKSQN
jgi:hypothetical protein